MSKFNENKQRAVALKYTPGKDKAPVVVASGSGQVANKIVEVASKHEIPVYQDDNVATLLSQLNLGSEIPSELYEVVVQIYVAILKTANQHQSGNLNILSTIQSSVSISQTEQAAQNNIPQNNLDPSVSQNNQDDDAQETNNIHHGLGEIAF